MIAHVDRTQAPAAGPAPEVHLGDHRSFLMGNGMRVIIVENHKIPVVSAQLRFDIPPIMQGDIAGYQDLVGELLTTGTASHTKEQIDLLVDGLGARLSGSGDGLFASCLKKNFPQLMELVAEVIRDASYPAEEFEKAKTRMLSQISARGDDPDQIAEVVGHALTFGKDLPYGEVTTSTSMGKVGRDEVHAYYRYFFQPEKGYLVLVGDIDLEEGKAMAEQCFGNWSGANVPTTTDAHGHVVVKGLGPIIPGVKLPGDAPGREVALVDRPGSTQSVIKVVFPVDLKPDDPMAIQGQVLNTIFGGGVFNARLMQNLREDKGYTYGAYSSLDPDRWAGSFSAGASVRTEVTHSAVVEIVQEMERIRKEPVGKDEIELVKSNMAGSFARSLEDPRTVARFALNTYLYGLAADHYENYLKRLGAVDIADVQRAAQRFLKPDNATILVVGDKEKIAEELAALSTDGKVVCYDTNGDVEVDRLDPVPTGMTAQQVIDAYIVAIGGSKALMKIKDLKREYTTTIQGMPGTLVEYNQAPDRYAMEIRMGAVLVQQLVYDGKQAKSGGMQGKKILGGDELKEVRRAAYAFPELHYHDLQLTAELTGITEIDGHKAYRIVVKDDDGPAFTEFYDVRSGMKVRRVEVQGGGQVITDFLDRKEVGGVLIPHTLRQNAGMDILFTATKISVDQGIDPAVFNVD